MAEKQLQALVDFTQAEVQVALARVLAPERMEDWIIKRQDALDRLNKSLKPPKTTNRRSAKK